MFSGKSLENALLDLSKKIDSNILERTIWLINEGMKKGGELGNLLLRVSRDLQNEEALRKEINANVSMYLTLILISSAIAAPILFGASTMVAEMMSIQTESISIGLGNESIPVLGGLLNSNGNEVEKISIEILWLFSIATMLITSLFASFLIGIIKYNREISGIKYFPIIAIIAIIIYFLVLHILSPFMATGTIL